MEEVFGIAVPIIPDPVAGTPLVPAGTAQAAGGWRGTAPTPADPSGSVSRDSQALPFERRSARR